VVTQFHTQLQFILDHDYNYFLVTGLPTLLQFAIVQLIFRYNVDMI